MRGPHTCNNRPPSNLISLYPTAHCVFLISEPSCHRWLCLPPPYLCSVLFRAMPSRRASTAAKPGAVISVSATGPAPSLLCAPMPRSPAFLHTAVSHTPEPLAHLPRQWWRTNSEWSYGEQYRKQY
jgi:hypothetical protein